MAHLEDVAKRAWVSVATVSRVMNGGRDAARISEECARRVRAAAREVGYVRNYHARSMRTGRAETLALSIDGGEDQPTGPRPGFGESHYWAGLVGGSEAAANDAGFALTVMGPGAGRTAVSRAVQGTRERRYDGVVIPATVFDAQQFAKVVDAADVPLVLVQPVFASHLPTVDFDHDGAVRQMVQFLAESGHRELLWVGPQSTPNTATRDLFFMSATWGAGLRGACCYYAETVDAHRGNAEAIVKLSERAMFDYLASPRRFTAVGCYNDLTAIGVCRALMRRGKRIPADVSVIGIDNTAAPLAWPPLTTIDHSFGEMGYRATEMLIELVRGGDDARKKMRGRRVVIEPRLVVRESTGPGPA